MLNAPPPSHEGQPAADPIRTDHLAEIPELFPIVERELTQESVDELRQILEQDYHVKLTNEDSWESARNLVRFGALLVDFSVERERRRLACRQDQ